MSFNAEVLYVLIASPSDVNYERERVEKAIFTWNKRFAEQLGVILLPKRWEDDVAPSYRGSDPQQIINDQIVHKCEILVGIFWTRLGNPTLGHEAGTIEEINIFIQNKKEVMLYFVEKDIPRSTDFVQLQRLNEFKKEYSKKGIYSIFDESKIIDHLYKKVTSYKNRSLSN